MQRILVVVDDNVNARIVCEVLLDSRGERCRLLRSGAAATGAEPPAATADVVLLEAKLQQADDLHALQRTLEEFQTRTEDLVAVLVITDEPGKLEEGSFKGAIDRVLRTSEVGGRFLGEIDGLRQVSESVPPLFAPGSLEATPAH